MVFSNFRKYDRITGMSRILRRYLVMNAFDGALTTLGLLFGAFFGGLQNNETVFLIGLSTAAAVSLSGFSGAFFAEEAERKKELHELERALLHKLKKTDYAKAFRFATYAAAAVDGFSPLLAALVILSPFLLLASAAAYLASFCLGFSLLFLLGAYLGVISKENFVGSGIKMVAVGAIALLVSFLLRTV
ncbi:MAG: VIT1/CCC1 transporter family protein [Candidatus Micrarchaeota archaeon]